MNKYVNTTVLSIGKELTFTNTHQLINMFSLYGLALFVDSQQLGLASRGHAL